MFWIIFPVADKVCQAILNSIHGIAANQGIGDARQPRFLQFGCYSTVAVAAEDVLSKIPLNPPVPVPIPVIVIAPILLFEIGFELEVKS